MSDPSQKDMEDSPMRDSDIIRMSGVTKVYKSGTVELSALRGIDLAIRGGEMLAVIGPSGSGKSTLMNLMGCLDVPSGGTYEFGGRDVALLSPEELAELRNRSIGFVFQAFHLLPHGTASENVEMPLLFAGLSSRRRRARALEMLERVGLAERAGHLPTQLSGGEMQRVAVARALANDPRVILADEPTGNLDSRTGRGILQLFHRLHDEGVTIVLITHDLSLARTCPRILNIQDGRIVHDGSDVPAEEEPVPEDMLPLPSHPRATAGAGEVSGAHSPVGVTLARSIMRTAVRSGALVRWVRPLRWRKSVFGP
jgi:putative ABC transport system ATP-binding protein